MNSCTGKCSQGGSAESWTLGRRIHTLRVNGASPLLASVLSTVCGTLAARCLVRRSAPFVLAPKRPLMRERSFVPRV
eukprot:503818-Amphidinium_carterae.4